MKLSLDRLLIIGVLLLTGGLIWVVYPTLEVHITGLGDTAPDFSIVDEHGRTITRSDFGGKVLALNFWASWCSTCYAELPSMNQFAEEYGKRGVVVLGVSIDKNEALYRKFLVDRHIKYDTARDPEADISSRYGTFLIPETYIIDRNGKVVEKAENAFNWMDPQFLARINSLL